MEILQTAGISWESIWTSLCGWNPPALAELLCLSELHRECRLPIWDLNSFLQVPLFYHCRFLSDFFPTYMQRLWLCPQSCNKWRENRLPWQYSLLHFVHLLIAFPSLPQQSPVHHEGRIQTAEKPLPEHQALTSPLIACDTQEMRRGGGWSNGDCCWPVNTNLMLGVLSAVIYIFFFLVELTFENGFS